MPLGESVADRLHVEIGDGQGVVLDELAPRFDLVAHQSGEQCVGIGRIVHLDQQQQRALGSSVVSQILGIHLAEALVTLHGQPLAACRGDGVEQASGPDSVSDVSFA